MTDGSERRRTIRVVVTSPINVQSPVAQVTMSLLNVSAGGFAVSSSAPLPVGVVMTFRFTSNPGTWSTLLTAKGAYSRPHHTTPDGHVEYLSGFSFLNPETPGTLERILALMDHATSVVTFS